MNNKMKVVGVVLAVLTAIVGVFEQRNDANSLERSGVKKDARQFAKSCESDMNSSLASFHFGAPGVKVGCVCIGVKLQDRSIFDNFKVDAVSSLYAEFILENKTVMNPRKRALMLSKSGAPINGADIRYSNTPQLTPIPHTSPETQDMAAALTTAFAYCSQYTRDGVKHVDVSRLPEHLR